MIQPPAETPQESSQKPPQKPASSDTAIWTVGDLLKWTEEKFKALNLDSPRLDAELLLAEAMGIQRLELYTGYTQIVEEHERAQFKTLITRRSRHEPIAYILGRKEFFSLPFEVNSQVLIPRPETEHLVERVLEHFNPKPIPKDLLEEDDPQEELPDYDELEENSLTREDSLKEEGSEDSVQSATDVSVEPIEDEPKEPIQLLDLGTGSGIIAITLAVHLKHASVVATDISEESLRVAQRNVALNEVTDQVSLYQGDLFQALPQNIQPFDAIISNPPYIAPSEEASLMPDVRNHEPSLALIDRRSQDGLSYYREIIQKAPQFLKPGGLLAFEVGETQAQQVKALLQQAGMKEVGVELDLAQIPRVVWAQY